MPNPNSYALNIPDPTQSVLAGVQGGANMANTLTSSQWAKDDRATAQAAAQAAAAKQQALERQLAEVSKNPTADKINQMMIAHPGLSESLKAVHGNISTQESTAAVNAMSPIFAAYQNKQPGIAGDLLEQQRVAAANTGDYKKAAAIETLLKLHDADPAAAQASIGVRLGTLGGLDKFATVAETLAKTPGEVSLLGGQAAEAVAKGVAAPETIRTETKLKKAQTEQSKADAYLHTEQARNVAKSQKLNEDEAKAKIDIEWAKIALDRDKLKELPPAVYTDVTKSVTAATDASLTAKKMSDLAVKFGAVTDKGASASINEFLRDAVGTQDEITRTRAEFDRLRNSTVLKNLPPGPATDKDIDFAAKGYPSNNASPEYIGSYLRGMAKIQLAEAAQHEARAAWLTNRHSLGSANADGEIGGIPVTKGMKFNDYAKLYIAKEMSGGVNPTGGTAPQAVETPTTPGMPANFSLVK